MRRHRLLAACTASALVSLARPGSAAIGSGRSEAGRTAAAGAPNGGRHDQLRDRLREKKALGTALTAACCFPRDRRRLACATTLQVSLQSLGRFQSPSSARFLFSPGHGHCTSSGRNTSSSPIHGASPPAARGWLRPRTGPTSSMFPNRSGSTSRRPADLIPSGRSSWMAVLTPRTWIPAITVTPSVTGRRIRWSSTRSGSTKGPG